MARQSEGPKPPFKVSMKNIDKRLYIEGGKLIWLQLCCIAGERRRSL